METMMEAAHLESRMNTEDYRKLQGLFLVGACLFLFFSGRGGFVVSYHSIYSFVNQRVNLMCKNNSGASQQKNHGGILLNNQEAISSSKL